MELGLTNFLFPKTGISEAVKQVTEAQAAVSLTDTRLL
jgi:hypothetical protein